jgi:hypothetical protein
MSKEIVKILMERDGLTEEEAEERVDEVREMFEDCEYDSTECELIMAEELGLELDYVFDLLL